MNLCAVEFRTRIERVIDELERIRMLLLDEVTNEEKCKE